MKKTIIILIFCTICLKSVFSQNPINNQKRIEEATKKFNTLLNYINNYYVDTANYELLTEKAIIAVLKELDPHSVYFTAKELKEANEPLEGNFEGIGIQFNIFNDTIVVISAIAGGPSEKLGILPGDKIVKIEGEDATGSKITNSWVVSKLRGKKGTVVNISILRTGYPNLLEFSIVRDKIPIYSVDAHFMIEPEIGYIKLSRFSATSLKEVKDAIYALKTKGMKSLIFDLRGNSGGYLQTAFDIADQFIPAGKNIVYTEGLHSPMFRYDATSSGDFEKGKLVILIDEGSASASEIVSGAVQDWDRGLIVGRRSFGKGLVQRPYNFSDGSAVRLTTARYHTPTGSCIQKPYNEGTEKYFKDLEKRYKHGELVNPDSIKFPDSLKYYTPNKRVVYGGGGIMPDIFVPLDTSYNSKYLTQLYSKGIFNLFSLDYIDKNRKKLNEKYPKFEIFKKDFQVDNSFFNSFIEFAEKKGVAKNEKEIEISKAVIENQIKANIARNLWGFGQYIEIIASIDNTLQKAVEIIKDNNIFKKYLVQSY